MAGTAVPPAVSSVKLEEVIVEASMVEPNVAVTVVPGSTLVAEATGDFDVTDGVLALVRFATTRATK